MLQSTALSTGSGGFESIFETKEGGQIFERSKQNNTSAYMLVYIRETDRQ